MHPAGNPDTRQYPSQEPSAEQARRVGHGHTDDREAGDRPTDGKRLRLAAFTTRGFAISLLALVLLYGHDAWGDHSRSSSREEDALEAIDVTFGSRGRCQCPPEHHRPPDPPRPPALSPLFRKLERGDRAVDAADQLMHFAVRYPTRDLLPYLRSPSPSVQEAAIHMLGMKRDTAAFPAVLRLFLRTKNRRLRHAAADALSGLSRPEDGARLVDLIRQEPDDAVQYRLAQALEPAWNAAWSDSLARWAEGCPGDPTPSAFFWLADRWKQDGARQRAPLLLAWWRTRKPSFSQYLVPLAGDQPGFLGSALRSGPTTAASRRALVFDWMRQAPCGEVVASSPLWIAALLDSSRPPPPVPDEAFHDAEAHRHGGWDQLAHVLPSSGCTTGDSAALAAAILTTMLRHAHDKDVREADISGLWPKSDESTLLALFDTLGDPRLRRSLARQFASSARWKPPRSWLREHQQSETDPDISRDLLRALCETPDSLTRELAARSYARAGGREEKRAWVGCLSDIRGSQDRTLLALLLEEDDPEMRGELGRAFRRAGSAPDIAALENAYRSLAASDLSIRRMLLQRAARSSTPEAIRFLEAVATDSAACRACAATAGALLRTDRNSVDGIIRFLE